MSKELLMEYLEMNSEADKLKVRWVMEIAPLLQGMKLSCILMVPHGSDVSIRKELVGTGICCVVLHKNAKKTFLMFYRVAEMKAYLAEEKVKSFLLDYGYHCNGIAEYILLLGRRVGSFYEKNQTFPHEIGAFLGYPIQDVKGFIENSGKNYLLSGYWKVYSDSKRAQEIFRKFDEAKERAVRDVIAGKQIRDMIPAGC